MTLTNWEKYDQISTSDQKGKTSDDETSILNE